MNTKQLNDSIKSNHIVTSQHKMSNQIDKVSNEEFWSLIVRKDGTFQIGSFSMKTRNLQNASTSWGTISHSQELISVIYEDNFTIIKGENKKPQSDFWKQNKETFNFVASRIANHWDREQTHCIFGDCQFIFEKNPEKFPKIMLEQLATKYNIIK